MQSQQQCLTERLEPACQRARDARVGQLLTSGHSAMVSDLAAADPVHVSADCPLGHADDQHGLDEFVQQCRRDAGTLAYRLPSCSVRYRSVLLVLLVLVVLLALVLQHT